MKKRALLLLLVIALAIFSIGAQSAREVKDGRQEVRGQVKEIEKYGHALLDITIDDFHKAGYELGDTVDVVFDNGYKLAGIPFFNGYYVDRGQPLLRAYPGHENIAVCINYGKLNEVANVRPGSKVRIKLNSAGQALETQILNSLVYTKNRDDYKTDEIFANFREINAGNIAEGKLYRSASPVDNQYNRASYADMFANKVGIKTIINLADNKEDFESYLTKEDFNSPYAEGLYRQDSVILCAMSVDFASQSFAKKLVSHLVQLPGKQGPVLIHCTEGKDRAGFVSALVEALMGASYDEIVEDYMKSYENYYGITKENSPERYDIIVRNNIDAMLRIIAGVDNNADLKKADLAAGAENYLISNGMPAELVQGVKYFLSN